MVWALTAFAFVITAFAVLVVFYAFSQRDQIWKALKKAQQEEAKGAGGPGNQRSDRRRSERVVRRVPVLVYGHAPGEEPFHEEATTLQVCAYGGLLRVATSVKVGQRLLLTNKLTQEEQQCHVIRFGPQHGKKLVVAIEFTRAAPDFWCAERRRPRAASS